PSKLSDIYATADKGNYFYGRVNNNLYAPSKYLIDCFSEYDKRWENSFVTAFSEFSMKEVAWVTYESKIKELSAALCTKYGIDAKHIGKKIYPYADVNAINLGSNGGNQYVAKVWPKGDYSADVTKLVQPKNVYVHPYPLAADEDRFIVYLSKQALSAADKAERAYITVNIDDLFDSEGKYISSTLDGTNTYQLFPSLSKFNWSYEGLIYGSNLQCKTGDMFIMRMAEVYLIAAEANLKTGNANKAAEHLNVFRKRACRNAADFEAHMKLTTATLDTVMDEYARELCGEFSRWALLKRHKAFEDRLGLYNKRAAASFKPVNYLRPISYDFLSQIDNADEYGTNGY
ncbi:RagB/SusD family nutrient uptake outer membrane protein, partial [Bacteroidales bacterium OttesenSCG-928-J19]|nr:RagB/SusD family nutrient uptake outer membrane protein [Bacteroidales bacterium OttesenSCG-928-J19]